jgi:hypothetical protein
MGWSSKTCNMLNDLRYGKRHLVWEEENGLIIEWSFNGKRPLVRDGRMIWEHLNRVIKDTNCSFLLCKTMVIKDISLFILANAKMKTLLFSCILSFLWINLSLQFLYWSFHNAFLILRRLTSMTTTRARWKLGMDPPCFYSGMKIKTNPGKHVCLVNVSLYWFILYSLCPLL